MGKAARSWLQSALGLGAFTSVVAAVAGARATPDEWFRQLRKPSFTPPEWVFGPAWTVLYSLIAVSGWRVWKAPGSPERTAALALWAAQLGLNVSWTWLFFGQHQPAAALADIMGLEALIGGYITQAGKVDSAAAWLMLPYLAWVAGASVIHEEIIRLNPNP